MAGINKVILIGNLGKDPEVKYLDSGVAVANFSLATSENYIKIKKGKELLKQNGIILFYGEVLAEVAEKYLKKGSSVYIEGKIKQENGKTKMKIKDIIRKF